MANDSRYLELTSANIRHGHIYLGKDISIFPPDVLGGANKAQAASRAVDVHWGSEVVRTDIDKKKKIFRQRAWVREFFSAIHAAAGHRIILEQLNPYSYRVTLEPTKPITCLSIQQPWADLIIDGKKRVENRSWDWPPFQKRLVAGEKVTLGIQVSSGQTSWNSLSPQDRNRLAPGWSPGIGSAPKTVVGLVDVVRICAPTELEPQLKRHKFTDSNQKWCWVLANPRRLSPPPFKARGKLKPFEVLVPRRLLPAELR